MPPLWIKSGYAGPETGQKRRPLAQSSVCVCVCVRRKDTPTPPITRIISTSAYICLCAEQRICLSLTTVSEMLANITPHKVDSVLIMLSTTSGASFLLFSLFLDDDD